MSQPLEVRNVQQTVELAAPPDAVYTALMDAQQHAAFTGFDAEIDAREGGAFTTGSGRNIGYTLVLVPGRRIVQAWRHRDWSEHHYSIATFDLMPMGRGTRLTFTQLGVPSDAYEWMDEGWRTTYWSPLARYLAIRRRA
ncbi:SRPBCC domain-containing protein [Archangium violaceum]|uniref:SRPBCC domain-containing protein n=1 Tax=Archangium violaceum TaxID=83451 RepID=UPI00193C0F16|nr:SRPBCC domain-containing protein [Archangium violaceum]QRK12449.1 SRPBCC domain-containing protein [Archangium violaceum]